MKIYGIAALVAACANVNCSSRYEIKSDSERDQNMGVTRTAWSQNGTLITGNGNQKVTMQCELEPESYTVQFTVTPPTTGATTQALVTWIVNGNPVQRLVDVSQGNSIQGEAEAVRVIISDISDFRDYSFPPELGKSYPVGVTVAKGTRAAAQQPILTPGPALPMPGQPQTGVTNYSPGSFGLLDGATVAINIPLGIGVISTFITARSFPAGTTVDQTKAIGTWVVPTTLGPAEVGGFPINTTEWIPIPSGATQLLVTNIAGSGIIEVVQVVFGIDG